MIGTPTAWRAGALARLAAGAWGSGEPVDLRIQLVWRVAGLSAMLLVVFCAGVLGSLRDDVADEVEASSRLAELIQASWQASTTPDDAQAIRAVERLVATGALRHVEVSVERADGSRPDVAVAAPAHPLVAWLVDRLPTPPALQRIHRLALGSTVLVIRPNPRSEVAEIVHDAARTLATLVLFAGLTVGVTWFAAHRALAPVRELEAGLDRIAQRARPAGDLRAEWAVSQARLPRFRLREFDRIARAIDGLAHQLDLARQAQHQLAQRLIAVQEAERHELARELHDEMGQSLTAVSVSAAYIDRHVDRADPQVLRDCARDILGQVKAVTRHIGDMLGRLRPHGLEGMGSLAALRELVAAWQQRHTGVALDVDFPPALPALQQPQALALYRGLQEALTNALRHSGARRVSVRLQQGDGGLTLSVEDNGGGRAADVERRVGAGLLGMAERAAAAGGRVSLQDGVGGLRVVVQLPVTAEAEASAHSGPFGALS